MVKNSFFKNFGAEAISALKEGASLQTDRPFSERPISSDLTDNSKADCDSEFTPIEIINPSALKTPVIFASPHSGRHYPASFLELSRLNPKALRFSEDSYVDLLFESAPRYGAPLLKALFPRAYVDVNRSEKEIDPSMFQGRIPSGFDTRSNRVMAGLGVIPKIVADGQYIYGTKLPLSVAAERLNSCYMPYHKALSHLIAKAKETFGVAVVVDCHSMPSAGGAPLRAEEPPIDFVLGDRFGVSCAACLPGLIESVLHKNNHHVVRNAPYAGGYVANAYGRPLQGVHVIQVEINRRLYLDETRITRTEHFDPLRAQMEELVAELTAIDPGALRPVQAAE